MRIHKKTSIPKAHPTVKGVSCDVLIWDGEKYQMAYYFFVSKEWFITNTLDNIDKDFVWIYPPISKMKEAFNRIIKK